MRWHAGYPIAFDAQARLARPSALHASGMERNRDTSVCILACSNRLRLAARRAASGQTGDQSTFVDLVYRSAH
jgi:hypothetical protein